MVPVRFRVKSLSGTIFKTVLWFSLVIVVVFASLAGAIFYRSFQRAFEQQQSILEFLGDLAPPLLLVLGVVAFLALLVSRALARRIMQPIDALSFKEPLKNEIFEEMDPLLVRIDEQQLRLKKQNEDLALAENMRREFSSNVSHEMKTPLQVISGYAELLKNDMVAPDDRRRFAGLIYDEAQTMRSLINDVLTISRLDEAFGSDKTDMPVDLYQAAQRVLSRLQGFALSSKVTLRVDGAPTCILGTETLAEEMLYNLMENGIRYNHAGGSVSVRIGTDKDGVVVAVSDSGPGIPEEYRDKIFERFFRVDKSRSKETGGTGLGLAIVKHAVQYHKGTIEVQSILGQEKPDRSRPDEKTTFVLHFPSLPAEIS